MVAHVKLKLEEFKAHLPLIHAMLNPGMRERHWRRVKDEAGRSVQPNEMSTLHSLIAQQVGDHLAIIHEASETASKEHSLEKALDRMLGEWKPVPFDCVEYRDTGTHILRGLDEIQSLFDDHIVKTQAMRGSPFIKPFERRVREWEEKLLSMQETLDEWLKCQSVWLYLEPIFGRGAMPHEQARFRRVDEDFRAIMLGIGDDPRVFSLAKVPQLEEQLSSILDQLERCQKALADFLEDKRRHFPRFYFIGDDDLLEILGQAKNPLVIQSHLKKLFAGIHRVDFSEGNSAITAMLSLDGEKVVLLKPVAVTDAVETWLQQLSQQMKATLTHEVAAALAASGGAP